MAVFVVPRLTQLRDQKKTKETSKTLVEQNEGFVTQHNKLIEVPGVIYKTAVATSVDLGGFTAYASRGHMLLYFMVNRSLINLSDNESIDSMKTALRATHDALKYQKVYVGEFGVAVEKFEFPNERDLVDQNKRFTSWQDIAPGVRKVVVEKLKENQKEKQ